MVNCNLKENKNKDICKLKKGYEKYQRSDNPKYFDAFIRLCERILGG